MHRPRPQIQHRRQQDERIERQTRALRADVAQEGAGVQEARARADRVRGELRGEGGVGGGDLGVGRAPAGEGVQGAQADGAEEREEVVQAGVDG